ncbi:hypothetical protein H337_22100 [Vibrio parahaemolyticus EN9701121]|nr:hypothetical protein H337_22100 [Vibrio parahaemolyticus EN9701121]
MSQDWTIKEQLHLELLAMKVQLKRLLDLFLAKNGK